MQAELEKPATPSVSSLVGGLIEDGQTLLKQQLELFKREVEGDMRKTGEVLTSLVVGVAAGALAAGLFCLTLVYLLRWATEWDLWACYAVVTAAFVAIAGVLLLRAYKLWQSYNPLPDKTVAGLQENLTWQTNPK